MTETTKATKQLAYVLMEQFIALDHYDKPKFAIQVECDYNDMTDEERAVLDPEMTEVIQRMQDVLDENEEMLENDVCPDCLSTITYEREELDGGYSEILSSCKC